MASSKRMPVLYIPHGGGPWPFMEWDPPDTWTGLTSYLKGIDATIGRKPKAVLMISAHWEERIFTVQSTPAPSLIYDYSGFPENTYKLRYPAPGAPEVAQRAETLLKAAGFDSGTNATRGFDHGSFVPLMMMYPAADVPVVQMSLLRRFDPAVHINAGRALAPLRDEDVLIVGSGMSYHNLGGFGRPQAGVESRAFDAWLTESVEVKDVAERTKRLNAWSSAPSARAVHPREEHLLPLMVAAGAAGDDLGRKVFEGEFYGTRYSGFHFG